MTKQYFVKVVTDNNGIPVYFNFGMDKQSKYKNVETSLNDVEYISITCYTIDEYEEYKEHIKDLLSFKNAKLSIVI